MPTKSYWQAFQHRRVSRRRLLELAGTGVVGLAVVGACGGGGDDASPSASPPSSYPSKRGGRYRYSIPADWGTIDPVTSVGFAFGILPRIYNVLLDRSRLDAGFFYFDLAESFEQPDEETYVFALRPDVKIAPNDLGIEERAMDAFDGRAWLERIDQDRNAVARAFTGPWLDSFEAPDARTFTMRTNGPYAYFLFRIGPPLGGTIPPREFFERGNSLEAQGVGGGPFAIVPGSYSNDGGILVTRNTNYYRTADDGEQLPYLDEVEAVRISDRLTRRVAFEDMQIHTYDAEGRDEVEELERRISGLQIVEDPATTFVSFVMNPTRPPWNDDLIRKAALHALNRQEFVDRIVGPSGGQPDGLVHWPLADFALPPSELEVLQPFDPDESRRLIRAATGEDTIGIDVIYPVTDDEYHDKHLPIFLQQMKAAGFEVHEDARDIGGWLADYQSLNYDASLSINQEYETAEMPLDFHSAAGPQGDGNFAVGIGALFPDVEEAIQASKRVADPQEQIEKVRDAQRLIYERGPASLPIMSWMGFSLYHDSVKDVPRSLGTTGLFLTSEIWLDEEA